MSAACPSVGRLVGCCSLRMEWQEALARLPSGHGVLAGYSRYLRLLSGLNAGSGFSFLAAQVNASINGARVRELAADPLVQLFTQRIREVGQVDRDLLRFLVLSAGPVDDRRDRSLLDVLWRPDPLQDPVQNLEGFWC